MPSFFSFLIPKSKQIIEKGVFRNGVARVKCKNGRYNFVNEKGRFLFKEGFHRADEFNDICTLADGKLIKISGEILHYHKVEKVAGHDGIFAAWTETYTTESSCCAFINNKGVRLTDFDYTFFRVRADGTISASYTKEERGIFGNIRIEERWHTILNSELNEITPRLGDKKIKVKDSLYIYYIYKINGINTFCLYNSETNVIISENIVSYIPESGHYIKWVDTLKNEYDEIHLHEWRTVTYAKYGIVDSDLNPIINCIYDMITTSPNNRIMYHNDPESIFQRSQHEATIKTGYYFVNNFNLKGLYTDRGKYILEPRYKTIKTKDYKTFIAESDKSISIYSEEDGFVRLLVKHHVIQYGESNRMSYIEKKFNIVECNKLCDHYFVGYEDPKTGKVGLIDDRFKIILDPIYDSIDYNCESFTACNGNVVKRYFWDQYINDHNDTFTNLNLEDFPIENLDEISNSEILQGNPKTILFFDTETNGLPKDYNASPHDVDNWPRALQVSWVIADDSGFVLKKRNYYIRPKGFSVIKKSINNPYAIPESILLEKGVDIKVVLEELCKDIHSIDLIVGHNVKFDKRVIQAELIRLNNPDIFSDKQIFCTMLAGKPICEILSKHGFKYPKLQELYHHLFKKKFEGAHDALNDVEATIECFFKMWKN